MEIDLSLVGEKALGLMEKEILRIMKEDKDFFVDKFTFDRDVVWDRNVPLEKIGGI
jgi:hypothetical protein